MDNAKHDPLEGRELEIRRLRRQDAEFSAVWEDYSEVLAVLCQLGKGDDADPKILRDYLRLRTDLARELSDWLDADRLRRQRDP